MFLVCAGVWLDEQYAVPDPGVRTPLPYTDADCVAAGLLKVFPSCSSVSLFLLVLVVPAFINEPPNPLSFASFSRVVFLNGAKPKRLTLVGADCCFVGEAGAHLRREARSCGNAWVDVP